MEEERNKIYEKKASAWYEVTYHSDWIKKELEVQEPDTEGEMINLSFAWIATDYLARIKIAHFIDTSPNHTVTERLLGRSFVIFCPVDANSSCICDCDS